MQLVLLFLLEAAVAAVFMEELWWQFLSK